MTKATIAVHNDGGKLERELEVPVSRLSDALSTLRAELPDGWAYRVPPGRKKEKRDE
jgi:hypothetical protein